MTVYGSKDITISNVAKLIFCIERVKDITMRKAVRKFVSSYSTLSTSRHIYRQQRSWMSEFVRQKDKTDKVKVAIWTDPGWCLTKL